MNPEERKMLERLLVLSESNNRVLRRMRREQLWARFAKLIYLVIFIGIAIAGYYYLKPYLGNFQQLLEMTNQLKNFKFPGQ